MKLLTCPTAILLLTSFGTAADFGKGLVAQTSAAITRPR